MIDNIIRDKIIGTEKLPDSVDEDFHDSDTIPKSVSAKLPMLHYSL